MLSIVVLDTKAHCHAYASDVGTGRLPLGVKPASIATSAPFNNKLANADLRLHHLSAGWLPR